MTSLTGASGEDFASILRSLGYRMDRKPKPVEAKPAEPVEAPPPAATERTPAEAGAVQSASDALGLAAAAAPDASDPPGRCRDPLNSASLLPETSILPFICRRCSCCIRGAACGAA